MVVVVSLYKIFICILYSIFHFPILVGHSIYYINQHYQYWRDDRNSEQCQNSTETTKRVFAMVSDRRNVPKVVDRVTAEPVTHGMTTKQLMCKPKERNMMRMRLRGVECG